VLRSTWDYHLHLPEFLRWVAKVEASGLPLWNPPSTVRWNVDKAYLAEVEARGARIVPTRFAGRGSRTSLLALMLEAGWTEAVVKPSVSGGAFETWRAHRTPEDGARFARQLAQMDCLVQPLVPELITDGEWSLLFFEGRYSHAVLKRPGPEDFRVQEEFGGLFAAARPSPEVVADATRALGATGRETLYARVDGVLRADGARARGADALPGSQPGCSGALRGCGGETPSLTTQRTDGRPPETECTASARLRTRATGPSGRPPDRAISDTSALPTTTASACSARARACSGAEMPNPTATGAALAARTASRRAGRSAGRAARAPVTPVMLTK